MADTSETEKPLAQIYLPDADGHYRLWKTITETNVITDPEVGGSSTTR